MPTATCPDGHRTEDPEYCDVCGLALSAVLVEDPPTSAHERVPRPAPPAGSVRGGAADAAGTAGAGTVPDRSSPPAEDTATSDPVATAPDPAVPAPGPAAPALEPPAPTLLLAPGRLPRRRGPSTAALLRLLTAVTVAALALAFGALAVGTRAAGSAIEGTGRDTGPRVIATADLPRALAETDVHLAALVLLGGDPAYAQERSDALEAYRDADRTATELLLGAHDLAADLDGRPEPAAEGVQGAAARATDLAEAYGRYRELAGRALALSEAAAHPAGAVPDDAARARAEAAAHLRETVLPLAREVGADATDTAVRRTGDTRDTVAAARTAVAAGSAAALSALVGLQVFLARRFRRTFSPALLVATAVTAIYTYTGVTVMGTQTEVLERMADRGLTPVAAEAAARTEAAVGAAEAADALAGGAAGSGPPAPYRDDPAATEEAAAAFTASVAAGDAAIGGLGFLIPVSMLSIAVVVVVGITPRLAEYR